MNPVDIITMAKITPCTSDISFVRLLFSFTRMTSSAYSRCVCIFSLSAISLMSSSQWSQYYAASWYSEGSITRLETSFLRYEWYISADSKSIKSHVQRRQKILICKQKISIFDCFYANSLRHSKTGSKITVMSINKFKFLIIDASYDSFNNKVEKIHSYCEVNRKILSIIIFANMLEAWCFSFQ